MTDENQKTNDETELTSEVSASDVLELAQEKEDRLWEKLQGEQERIQREMSALREQLQERIKEWNIAYDEVQKLKLSSNG